jgi:outer membrane protein OmpA-like peptidoglycan-associated protein
MQKQKNILTRQLVPSLFLLGYGFLAFSYAQTDVDPPVTARIEANTDINVTSPTNTFYGTRGLTQTASAEALGEGRLIFGFYGSWYQQQKDFSGAPNKDANIFTGIGSISLGVNRQIDVFASLTGFGSTDYDSDSASGLGSVGGGIQGTLPFSPEIPVRMAAQVGIYQGLSENQINLNEADGYHYLETRTGLDFMAKLIQTLTLGHEKAGLKLHFNEGIRTSSESGTEASLQLAAGAQLNITMASFGLEINSRTPFSNISIGTDPLWLSPSVQFRTPFEINVTLGGDIALAGERNDALNSRGLEPFRLFGGLAFTFDTEYGKRAAAKAKQQREERERLGLQNNIRDLSKTISSNSMEDSLARIRQQEKADSLAGFMTSKAHQDSMIMAGKASQDSITMANKARSDSLALIDANNRLAEEKSKRSDAEKQLLSTGLLLLDAVYFETGKTDISINSKPYLNIIAKMLTKYPKLSIEISGHTDNVGGANYNMGLSEGRSQAVLSYMVQSAPELRGMLSAKGYGLTQPKADNKTAEGRKLNRRTELQVLNKEVLSEYNR